MSKRINKVHKKILLNFSKSVKNSKWLLFFLPFFFKHQRKPLQFVKRSLGSLENNGLKCLADKLAEKIQLPEAISYLGRWLIKFLSKTLNFPFSEFLAQSFRPDGCSSNNKNDLNHSTLFSLAAWEGHTCKYV